MSKRRSRQLDPHGLIREFDIARYDAIADNNINQWANLLALRFHFKRFIEGGEATSRAHWRDVYRACLFNHKQPMSDDCPPIHSSERERAIVEPYLADMTEFEGEAIAVNLTYPDDQIRRDFSEWLAKCRERRKAENTLTPKAKYTRADFDHWHSMRLLPYIDLTLLASAYGMNLKQKRLGELLFPEEHEVDLTERIRKVLKPLSARVLSQVTVLALQAQAGAEMRSTPPVNLEHADCARRVDC